MQFKRTEDIQDLLDSIRKGARAAVNLYSGEAELTESFAQTLQHSLQADVITLDVSAYPAFEELVRELVMQLLLREDKPQDCRVADTAIDELNIRLLRRHVSRLLNAFGAQGSWICLILKGFDAADGYWDDSAFAWMRELVDSGKIPTCVILSERPVAEVSDKPEGSSPLYNIFRSYPLQGEEV